MIPQTETTQTQLPLPILGQEDVQLLINFANTQLTTIYGNALLKFIEEKAIEQDRKRTEQEAK